MLKKTILAPLSFLVATLLPVSPVFAQQTVVGSVPGEFSVSGGSANYSVPISVAPGRGGMQPQLSLNYSSDNGNGELGLGWSLGGLSAIHRCSATIAQDGFASGVSFDANDRYCLNGQRLVPIPHSVTGGLTNEFRTEIDSYSSIKGYGGSINYDRTGKEVYVNPSYFVVQTKAGQVMTYGGGSDNASYNLPQGTMTWAIREITDTTHRNDITYKYFIHNSTQYLDEITYPGGSVDIVHETGRPDQGSGYLLGSGRSLVQRINKIVTYSNNVVLQEYKLAYENNGIAQQSKINSITVCDNSNTCFKPTEFNWSGSGAATYDSLISSTPTTASQYSDSAWTFAGMYDTNGDGVVDAVWQYKGSGDGTRIAVSLGQGNGSYDSILYSAPTTSGQYSAWTFEGMHDTNDDGLPDAIWQYKGASDGTRIAVSLAQGNGTYGAIISSTPTASGNYSTWEFTGMYDTNGDGLMDAIWQYQGASNGTRVAVSLAQGNGTYGAILSSAPTTSGQYNTWTFAGMRDTNSDGLPDAIWQYQGAGNGTRVAVSLAQGNGTYGSILSSTPTTSGHYNAWLFVGMHDTNGDGLADAVWQYQGAGDGTRVSVSLAQGDGTYGAILASVPTVSGQYSAWTFAGMHDANGDGLVDTVWQYQGAGDGTRVAVSLALGDGNYSSIYSSAPTLSGQYSTWEFAGMYDTNGDGLVDAIWQYKGAGDGTRVAVSLGQGDGTYGPVVYNSPTTSGQYDAWEFAGMHDTSGDGIADAVWEYHGSDGTRVATSLSQSQIPQLASIIDSNGNTTLISYKSLTDSTVYTKGTGATFPVRDVIYPDYVVSEVQTDNGIGGTSSVQYRYEGLKLHLQGRGSYGYSKITEIYPDTGKTMVSTYDQTGFPYTGSMLSTIESYNGQKINESINTFSAVESYPGIYQLNPVQSVQSSYELGSASQPVTTITTAYDNIDIYGNVGRITTTSTGAGQSFTKIAESNYEERPPGGWNIGRLSDMTVTHQSPYGSDEVRRSAFAYDFSSGLLTTESILDSTGTPLTTTTNTYDIYGQKTEVRLSASGESDRVTTTTYDATGRPTQTCNAYNQCETYTYTTQGWLESTTGPNSISTSIGYDSLGRQIVENRADGTNTTVSREFVSDGNCGVLANFAYTCSITQSSGSQPIIVQYDTLGREVRKITQGFDERLVYNDTEYNHLAQMSRASRDYYSGEHIYWAESEYDALDRVIRMTEPGPHGSTNEITYEYNGFTTTVRSGPEARAKTTITNAIGQNVRIEEEEGTYTEYTYRSDGNLLTTTVVGDVDTRITLHYDEFGRKIAMDDPDMGNWQYTYTPFGELETQTDAKGQVTTMAYDVLGRMVSRTEPEGTSTWVYGGNSAPQGSIGKLLQESGNGLTKDYSYDNLGRPVSTTTTIAGEGSFTTETQYDSLGRVQRVTYPGSQSFYTENIYNANGFLESVRGLRSQAEAHDYSALQPLIQEAVDLADDYLVRANQLRTIGAYYQSQIEYYQSLTGSGSVNSALQSQLTQHQTTLNTTVAEGQSTGVKKTLAQFIPIMMGDIMVPIVHFQQQQTLAPELLSHINNTIIELQTVTGLITTQSQTYASIAEQLVVLAEQTLAAADHNFQFVNTLDNSSAAYSDFIAEGSTSHITYWRAVDVDASGRISAEVYGNGIVNDYAYNQATGELQSIHSSLLVVDAIRHLEYQYDAYKNVTLRDDLVNDIRETYNYDRLDRLTSTQVTSSLYEGTDFNNTQSQTYNGLGNITDKSDVGAYSYGARPHAVTQAGGNTYSYDANGNMISGDGRTITYSSFNKPTQITRNGRSATFSYGPNRARYKKVNHKGETTLYVGPYERTTKANSHVEQKHYIYAAGQLVAEHILSSSDGTQTRYLHKDALGSVDMVTDAYANVVDRRSFDAWGKLRNMPWQSQAGLDDPLYLTQLPFTNKGYTGHEHVQEVELIHMNGRMYDATLARFISADPHIQAGSMSQSYNRYSYVMNNSMKYTDPSGYFFKKAKKKLRKLRRKAKRHVKRNNQFQIVKRTATRNYHKFRAEQERALRHKWVEQLGYVAAIGCGPFYAVCVGGHAAAVADAHGADFNDAFQAGVKAGVIAYVSQQASSYIGDQASWGRVGQAFAHGVVGGTISVIQGGKFGQGFASSFFTKIVSGPTGIKGLTGGNRFAGVAVAALVGGTASALGGGKFANGAATAAMQYAFNEMGEGLDEEEFEQSDFDKGARWLTTDERVALSSHFNDDVLDNVRIYEGKVPFWLRSDMDGITLGNKVYFRDGVYQPNTASGIELLAHELVHTVQYSQGMTKVKYLWQGRKGYWKNPYEVEAYGKAADFRKSFCSSYSHVRGC